MSIRIIQEVLQFAPADLGASARLVLIVLAEDAREDRVARYCKSERLCQYTGLSRSQVIRQINELEARGLIRRRGQAHKGKVQHYLISPLQAHHQAATIHHLHEYRKGAHTRDPNAPPPDPAKASHSRDP